MITHSDNVTQLKHQIFLQNSEMYIRSRLDYRSFNGRPSFCYSARSFHGFHLVHYASHYDKPSRPIQRPSSSHQSGLSVSSLWHYGLYEDIKQF